MIDFAEIITSSFVRGVSGQPEAADGQSNYINMLLSENRRMQERNNSLALVSNHANALAKHRAGFMLFKERKPLTLMQKMRIRKYKCKGWRKELKEALVEAEEAMKSAHDVEKELDSFYIICSSSFALNDTDQRLTLRMITYWTYYLLQEKSIACALEKLADCMQNPEASLSLHEVHLLSKFFKYIASAVMACALYGTHFYGREQNGDWIPGNESYTSERDELRNIVRESKYLKKATDPHFIKRWDDIRIRDGGDEVKVQWGEVHISFSALSLYNQFSTLSEARAHQFFSDEMSDCETVLSYEDIDSTFEEKNDISNSIPVQCILMDLCHCDSTERYIPGNVRVCKDSWMNECNDYVTVSSEWNDFLSSSSSENEYI